MKWMWRVLRAPGDDNLSLPTSASSWHTGRWVKLLDGHWNTIIQYAAAIDSDQAEKLDLLAQSHDDPDDPLDLQALAQMMPFVARVINALAQPDHEAMVQAEDDPDGFDPAVYRDMLLAVNAVFAESLRLLKPFDSWLEYS
jgi:hypothetical protein